MDHDLSKELAKLSLSIQEGRREFNELQAEKEAYLAQREVEASNRVLEALKRSEEAVKQTEDYVKLIETLNCEAENVVLELKGARELMQTERREFQQRTASARELLESRGHELELRMEQMNLEKVKLEGLVESVRLERAMLKEEQIKINDDRGKLRAAFQILKEEKYGRSQKGQ